MKKMKKLFAVPLALTMVLGLSTTAFAENSQGSYPTKPDNADKADVSITNITGNPDVTLYQIASVEYGPNGVEFVDYNWAADNMFADPTKPTSNEINAIAQRLTAETPTITALDSWTTENVGETYEEEVPAGAYIAVITGADNGDIYNPILLTATYNDQGVLTTETISSDANYLYGSTAVAKSSSPDVEKEITGGTTNDGGKETVSVGDVVDYKVTPTVPTYPANALNKTLFVTDTLSEGLTFDYSTLTVTVNNVVLSRTDAEGKATFSYSDGTKVAEAVVDGNGFNMNFVYESLVYDTADQVGLVHNPVITYSALVNDNALVGSDGNGNDVIYYYSDPNQGSTWEEVEKEPDKAEGVHKKEDSETVYTYQLAFLKTGVDTDDDGEADPLAGAVFGIYEDKDCTVLIDTVTTNANGYAVTANVRAGTYYVKELIAPPGYSLNTTVYSIEATWATATTTSTATETERTYTTTKPSDDALQVGWMKDGKFYSYDVVGNNTDGYQAAYLATEKTTSSTETSFVENGDVGGTALLDDAIPNTKLSTLPGTGGMGTTIFTIGGIVIMITAAGLFFANRRKNSAE